MRGNKAAVFSDCCCSFVYHISLMIPAIIYYQNGMVYGNPIMCAPVELSNSWGNIIILLIIFHGLSIVQALLSLGNLGSDQIAKCSGIVNQVLGLNSCLGLAGYIGACVVFFQPSVCGYMYNPFWAYWLNVEVVIFFVSLGLCVCCCIAICIGAAASGGIGALMEKYSQK